MIARRKPHIVSDAMSLTQILCPVSIKVLEPPFFFGNHFGHTELHGSRDTVSVRSMADANMIQSAAIQLQ